MRTDQSHIKHLQQLSSSFISLLLQLEAERDSLDEIIGSSLDIGVKMSFQQILTYRINQKHQQPSETMYRNHLHPVKLQSIEWKLSPFSTHTSDFSFSPKTFSQASWLPSYIRTTSVIINEKLSLVQCSIMWCASINSPSMPYRWWCPINAYPAKPCVMITRTRRIWPIVPFDAKNGARILGSFSSNLNRQRAFLWMPFSICVEVRIE